MYAVEKQDIYIQRENISLFHRTQRGTMDAEIMAVPNAENPELYGYQILLLLSLNQGRIIKTACITHCQEFYL